MENGSVTGNVTVLFIAYRFVCETISGIYPILNVHVPTTFYVEGHLSWSKLDEETLLSMDKTRSFRSEF